MPGNGRRAGAGAHQHRHQSTVAAHERPAQAVGAVRRIFNAQKAGHAGTLDPLATGILPIALGEATKTVPFVMDGRKAYVFAVTWGVETDTDDAEGRPVATSDERPTREQVEAMLREWTALGAKLASLD